MTRVEWIKPPPLDREEAIEAVLYEIDRLSPLINKGDFRGAVRGAEFLFALVKLYALHDERTANPIRVEYPE